MKMTRFNQTHSSSTKESVGPGKYDPSLETRQLHDMNCSNGFASKTLRVWDRRKG